MAATAVLDLLRCLRIVTGLLGCFSLINPFRSGTTTGTGASQPSNQVLTFLEKTEYPGSTEEFANTAIAFFTARKLV